MLLRYKGLIMSGKANGDLLITDFTPPTTAIRGGGIDRYSADGSLSPREWLGETSWVWTLATNVRTLAEAMRLASEVGDKWTDPTVRDSTSHVPLEYSHDGGVNWYRVYGRPGRYTPPALGGSTTQGVAYMELEFVQRDPNHYSSAERRLDLLTESAYAAGLRSPLRSPLTTVHMGPPRDGGVLNWGNRPSPATVRFAGPCKDPRVVSGKNAVIGYRGSLGASEYVVIDNFNQTVLLNGKTPVPGRLFVNTRLSDLHVPPGDHKWSFQSTDITGTAVATLSYRDAYSSMQY